MYSRSSTSKYEFTGVVVAYTQTAVGDREPWRGHDEVVALEVNHRVHFVSGRGNSTPSLGLPKFEVIASDFLVKKVQVSCPVFARG